MRRFCLIGLVLLGVVAVLPAWAQPVFSHPVKDSERRQTQVRELADSIRARSDIRGRFTQSKHLSVLSRPIESAGRFSLDDGGRFQWAIREPFPLTYRFDGERLVRIQDGESEVVKAADDPSLYGFFSFISNLFQLTDGELSEHFERFFQTDSEGWTLGLRPEDGRMRRALSQLVVTGRGARIEQAVLTEPNGDYTELRFFYSKQSGAGEDAAEP